MTVNHRPETALPFALGNPTNIAPVSAAEIAAGPHQIDSTGMPGYGRYVFASAVRRKDAAYLVHTGNAYADLVEMVHALYPLAKVGTVELGEGNDVLGRACKLMNDLGEEQP